MDSASHLAGVKSPLAAFEAAMGWWREAGVDLDYADQPTRWLAEPETREAVATPVPTPVRASRATPLERTLERTTAAHAIGGPPELWPDSLEKFREWWMSEPSLADTGPARRLPPRGTAGAQVMVLVAAPAPDDAKGLLTGAEGRLLASILRAGGVGAHETYFASAAPAPLALPDWQELANEGLGAVLAHHISLARPRRVILFGRAMLPLFGIDVSRSRAPATLEIGDSQIPMLPSPSLEQLARSAERRQNFWHRWLEWTR